MLQSLDEVKKVEMAAGSVMNGVDNANLMSVDSTTPIKTKVDILESEEEKGEVPDTSKTEKKPEEKVEALPKEKEEKKEEKPPETKDAVTKRIGDLTKKWRTAERERDFERARITKLEEELTKLKSTVPATAKPKKEDFEDTDAYNEALMDWKLEEKLRVTKEESAKKVEKDEEKAAVDEVFQNLDEVMEKGREKYTDFNELVLDENLVLTPEMTEVILQSESAIDLFYYLGQNPDESAVIAKMPLSRAAREIGKIEVKVLSEKKEEEEEEEVPPKKPPVKPTPPVKKTTKAPEPITPLKADGVVDKDPSQMTPKEYRAWRESKKG